MAGFAKTYTANLVVSFYFAKRGFENVARIIKRWRVKTKRSGSSWPRRWPSSTGFQQESVDAIVLKAVASVLASFGIEDDDRRELRADFQHLRRWRKSVEQAQSYTFKAVITVLATGLMGAVWLGVKVVLGKVNSLGGRAGARSLRSFLVNGPSHVQNSYRRRGGR